MSFSGWDEKNFISAAAAKELLAVLKGEKRELGLESGIQLESALEALRDGLSLTQITQKAICQLEKYIIVQMLKATAGNKSEAARILKIDYKTLYRKIYKYFGVFPDFIVLGSNGNSPYFDT